MTVIKVNVFSCRTFLSPVSSHRVFIIFIIIYIFKIDLNYIHYYSA